MNLLFNMVMPLRPFRAIVVPIIIIVNIGVYVMWTTSVPDHIRFMTDNFLVSWTGLLMGRYWTLLTSVFSHNISLHIFANMIVLNSFGPFLEQVLGRMRFLVFYLLAGVTASLCHCAVSQYFLHQPDQGALGASGALAGMLWVFCLLFPRERILLFFIIPLPAILGALVFVGLDLWGLSAQAAGGGLPIGHGAHLGGALFGILYYFIYLRPRIQRRRSVSAGAGSL